LAAWSSWSRVTTSRACMKSVYFSRLSAGMVELISVRNGLGRCRSPSVESHRERSQGVLVGRARGQEPVRP
jgi:hypothetical protein